MAWKMKSINLKQELSANQAILLVMKRGEYDEVTCDVIRQLSGKNVCYITLNKTFDSLKELFKKNRIDLKDAVFLDAISESIKKTFGQTSGCYFAGSPNSLKELSRFIDKFLRHKFEYFIFDSLTSLLTYQKKEDAEVFVSEFLSKIKGSKTKAVFYVLDMGEQEELIRKTEVLIGEVAVLNKKRK